MIRFYLRFTLPIPLLFALPMLLLRSQISDNAELRALLMPPDCQMPCFIGIQPGVTTGEEALHILETSGWTDRIRGMTHSNPNQISWIWNGSQPYWIEGHVSPSIKLKNDIVISINLRFNAPFSQVEEVFGSPVGIKWTVTGDSILEPTYSAHYPDMGITLNAFHRYCDLHTTIEGDYYSYITYQIPAPLSPYLTTDHATFYDACKYLLHARKR